MKLRPTTTLDPFAQYSLTGQSEALKAKLQDQKPALGPIALTGQATAIYAPPNTGKTLIALSLLADSISNGHIDPAKVYYFNMTTRPMVLWRRLVLRRTSDST